MNYTTKLTLGQNAWRMHENKPVCQPVEAIRIEHILSEGGKITPESTQYGFRIYFGEEKKNIPPMKFKEWAIVPQDKCFATKEELLASL